MAVKDINGKNWPRNCTVEFPDRGVIICPTCQNRITNLTALRCPRCFSALVIFGCRGGCSTCEAGK
ncbi:MAG: hypothetical protein CVV03_04855 [Firmicutes bacterium HGW-Firmicutes-8]|nr:MAG: hypothetical protein CVV03_04855 [Firmicutes bacterium HGW-Firmicutes-8]